MANTTTKVFFLIYRTSNTQPINWTDPDGGLVVDLECKRFATELAIQRYHCAPWEHLMMAEVWGIEEMAQAQWLHDRWEAEVQELEAQWGAVG